MIESGWVSPVRHSSLDGRVARIDRPSKHSLRVGRVL